MKPMTIRKGKIDPELEGIGNRQREAIISRCRNRYKSLKKNIDSYPLNPQIEERFINSLIRR